MVDLDAIRGAGLRLGVDPLGGASLVYWQAIAERHGLDLEVVNDALDPTFRFVPLDWDGKIRMDCSSQYAMARLRELAGWVRYRVRERPGLRSAWCGDARRGVVEPESHVGGVCGIPVRRRPRVGRRRGIGKTLVSSSIIDRVAGDLGRRLVEVPVGFKWFVEGLLDGTLGFGGEESAGASFLRRDGTAVEHRQGRADPVSARG